MTPAPSDPGRQTNRWMLTVLAAAFILYLAYLLRYVLLPFILAGGVAYVTAPAVNWIQKRFGVRRWAAALAPVIVMLIVLAVIGLTIYQYLLPQLNSMLANQTVLLEQFLGTLFRGHAIQIGGKTYNPQDAAAAIIGSLRSSFDPQEALQDVVVLGGMLLGGLLTVILFIYFLIDGPRIARGMAWVVPPLIRPEALAVARRADPVIHSYVRGIFVIMAYATALTFIVTRFVLHVHHAFLLALAIGVLELVPVIGPILSIVILCFVAIQQVTFWGIVGVAIFITALRVTIDQFVGPIVLGRSVRLPPPLIIFAFMAGGAIWGAMGVVVAIPAAAIIKIILEEAYDGEGKSDS